MNFKRIFIELALLALALLTACGGLQAADVEGTEWALVSLDGAEPISGTRVTLGFTAGTLEGFAGCNRYAASYTLKSGKFNIPEISSTAEGCLTPQGVLDQEAAYLNILSGVDQIKLADRNTLEMRNTARDAVLVFRRELQLEIDPADLEGTSWALRSLAGNPPLKGTSPTLQFKNGTIHGTAGCRTFTASYQAGADHLQLLMLEMNEIGCLKPEPFRDQENQLLDRLDDLYKYGLSGETLELITVQGETLTYGSLPGDALESGGDFTWVLDSFAEGEVVTAPLPGVEINLVIPGGTLRASGTFRGSAGCTLYEAPYAHDGSFFTLLSPSAPDPLCEPAVNAQQQRYLEILAAVKTIEVIGDTLRLNTAEGQALTFVVPGGMPQSSSSGASRLRWAAAATALARSEVICLECLPTGSA